jgi:hypothetical protein
LAAFLASHLDSSARAADRHPATVECGTTDLLAGKAPKSKEEAHGDTGLVTDGAVVPEGAVKNGTLGDNRRGRKLTDRGLSDNDAAGMRT